MDDSDSYNFNGLAEKHPDLRPLIALASEFEFLCEPLYSVYLDCTQACRERANNIRIESKKPGNAAAVFEYRRPKIHNEELLETATYRELIVRNSMGQRNHRWLGHFAVLFVHGLWEARFRDRFATALGVPPQEMDFPAIADLRLLRNTILRNQTMLSMETIESLQVIGLDASSAGDPLSLSEMGVTQVIYGVLRGVGEFAEEKARRSEPPKPS